MSHYLLVNCSPAGFGLCVACHCVKAPATPHIRRMAIIEGICGRPRQTLDKMPFLVYRFCSDRYIIYIANGEMCTVGNRSSHWRVAHYRPVSSVYPA